MSDLNFILPRNNSLGAYFVKVEGRKVNFARIDGKSIDVRNEDFLTVYTDMQFNPLQEKIEVLKGRGSVYFNTDELKNILSEFEAIEVDKNFDTHDIDHLKSIKNKLPVAWVDAYNKKHELKIT